MPSRKAATPVWEELLADVRDRHPQVVSGAMFGMPCAKVSGKLFMGSYDGGVVFKLPPPDHARALRLAGSVLFDPMGGRPMREWVVVRPEHRATWPELADAAIGYVPGAA